MHKLRQIHSTYGRLVPKPEKQILEEAVDDEIIPIQDQIENLRTKIALKERYNRVLRDDLEESKEGASSVLYHLYKEIDELRLCIVEALCAEKTAVQSALRTHRHFQLALSDKNSLDALIWIDDKIFDASKQLNSIVNRLLEKRKKLHDSEEAVKYIEKCPRPGSLGWELQAAANLVRLENMIEAMKVKRETAMILNAKYKHIRMTLKEEKCKYFPNLRNVETQLHFHRMELENIEKMVEDAGHFKAEAEKNMLLTEVEASENRKKRRRQMAKMKKSVTKVLTENSTTISVTQKPTTGYIKLEPVEKSSKEILATRRLEAKNKVNARRSEVEKFEARARRLVETMRVPDLTYIPYRLKTVMVLGGRLKMELDSKEQYRDLLLNHRDHLLLILCFVKYTGTQQDSIFNSILGKATGDIEKVQKKIAKAENRLHILGEATLNARLGVFALLAKLDEAKKEKRSKTVEKDFYIQLRLLVSKTKVLLRTVRSLRSNFVTDSERDYAAIAPRTPLPARLHRVGSPVVTDESDGDENFTDFKVPGRAEIKARSFKYIAQALLQRGIR